ncbi:MAG: D-glycerate dehydrogenase [SAR202 cluster bacterium]|nr:D-glycerate dehydrogenase [SAR202 cluster bacterium]
MPRPKVFVTRHIFPEALDMIRRKAGMELWEDEMPPPRATLLQKSKGVDGILCLLNDTIDAEFFDAAGPQLKVVSQIAVGYNNIDVPEATRRHVAVGYTPDVLTQTTADFTWALLMAGARRIVEGYNFVQQGKWRTWHPLHFLGQDIYGATLGIVGMGRIGFEVARRATGFDMKILYYDVNRRTDLEAKLPMTYVDMDTLLKEADFVTLHTNLTKETHHLMGDAQFKKMKPTALVVNAARGPVIDHKALYRALKNKTIGGAALDVTEPEPIPSDDPLLKLDNCLIVPHIASASVATRKEMSRLAAQNLINGLEGKELVTCVNPEVYHN